MTTAVDNAITEIESILAVLSPQHEGLLDFQRLNLQEPARTEIEAAIVVYERRISVLNSALEALKILKADGHPDLPVREISAAAFEDLQNNTSTIEAAMSRFASNAATSLTLNEGTVVPK